jgi:hypothetical protein
VVSALRQARETWAQVRREHAGHGGHWPGQIPARALQAAQRGAAAERQRAQRAAQAEQRRAAAERQRAEQAAQAQQRRAQAQQQRAERTAQAQQRRAQAQGTPPTSQPGPPNIDDQGSRA